MSRAVPCLLALFVACGSGASPGGVVIWGIAPNYRSASMGAVPSGMDNKAYALQLREGQAGRTFQLLRMYHRWENPELSAFEKEAVRGHRTLIVSWNLNNAPAGTTWSAFGNRTGPCAADAAGLYPCDERLATLARDLRDTGAIQYFIFSHEPDRPSEITKFGPAADFIAAWRHARQVILAIAPQVKFVWTVTGWGFSGESSGTAGTKPDANGRAAAFFPGDDEIDYIGSDEYNWSGCRSNPPSNTPWDRFATVFEATRTWSARTGLGLSKKIFVPEWGSAPGAGTGTPADKAEWFDETALTLQSPGWERFVALVYFDLVDQTSAACSWWVDDPASAEAGFVRMGSAPYFSRPAAPAP